MEGVVEVTWARIVIGVPGPFAGVVQCAARMLDAASADAVVGAVAVAVGSVEPAGAAAPVDAAASAGVAEPVAPGVPGAPVALAETVGFVAADAVV